jgi:hypothetical protein
MTSLGWLELNRCSALALMSRLETTRIRSVFGLSAAAQTVITNTPVRPDDA